MTDKELLKIVTRFRKGIIGNGSPLTMCWKVCLPLSTYLQLCGCENEVTEGTIHLNEHNEGISIGHFWLTLPDKRIIDPTASQFNGMRSEDMPIVYLGKKPDFYKGKS